MHVVTFTLSRSMPFFAAYHTDRPPNAIDRFNAHASRISAPSTRPLAVLSAAFGKPFARNSLPDIVTHCIFLGICCGLASAASAPMLGVSTMSLLNVLLSLAFGVDLAQDIAYDFAHDNLL